MAIVLKWPKFHKWQIEFYTSATPVVNFATYDIHGNDFAIGQIVTSGSFNPTRVATLSIQRVTTHN